MLRSCRRLQQAVVGEGVLRLAAAGGQLPLVGPLEGRRARRQRLVSRRQVHPHSQEGGMSSVVHPVSGGVGKQICQKKRRERVRESNSLGKKNDNKIYE